MSNAIEAIEIPNEQPKQVKPRPVNKYKKQYEKINVGQDENSDLYKDCIVVDNDITKEIKRLIDEYAGALPPIYKSKIPYYDLPDNYRKIRISVVNYKKLQQGGYYTGTAEEDRNKTDVMYAQRIQFYNKQFFNNKYITHESLRWIYDNHLELFMYILGYHKQQGNSIHTVNGDLKCLTRIIKLHNSTNNNAIYMKYSNLQQALKLYLDDEEGDNTLSVREEKKFLIWTKLQDIVEERINQWNTTYLNEGLYLTNKTAYKEHQKNILCSMYLFNHAPLRLEVYDFQFTTDINDIKDNIDYIYLAKKDNRKVAYLHLQKIKKKHQGIKWSDYEVPTQLARLLHQSYELYPRTYFMTYDLDRTKPMKNAKQITERIRSVYSSYKKDISVNSFRSSFVTDLFETKNSKNTLDKKAFYMRTSLTQMQLAYNKIITDFKTRRKFKGEDVDDDNGEIVIDDYDNRPLPNVRYIADVDISRVKIEENEKITLDTKTRHDKDKENSLAYYKKNKEKMDRRRKEHYKENAYKINRDKILYKLNETVYIEQGVLKSKYKPNDVSMNKYNIRADLKKKMFV